jgi:hypothetical protein
MRVVLSANFLPQLLGPVSEIPVGF